jgi:hypothetical protein
MPAIYSSAITWVNYDDQTRRLHITFHASGTYTYFGVPRLVYDGLLRAPSVGTYFNDNIRDRYATAG